MNSLKKGTRIMNRPILHLNLIGKYYDLIEKKIKKEEYRKIKPFWSKVFVYDFFADSYKIKIAGILYDPKDIIIRFSNGYSKGRRQMDFRCRAVIIAKENPAYSGGDAVTNEKFYTLVLGHRQIS